MGDDTLDYFALRRDKNYYFSADGRSLVAYVYVRGTAMVAGDPIGPGEDTARTIDEFLDFCARRGWRVAFFAVREATTPIYRSRGMHAIYLGDEAIVRCQEFSLDGPGMKAVRSAVRRVDRHHEFELMAETEASPELVAELNEISAEWRGGAPERGFTMELAQDVEGSSPTSFSRSLVRRAGAWSVFCASSPSTGISRATRSTYAPPARVGQRRHRVSDRAIGAGARSPRFHPSVAELCRVGTTARTAPRTRECRAGCRG